MTNHIICKMIDYYYDEEYYTLGNVKGFFDNPKNITKGIVALSDFEEITSITLEFYEEHEEEIKDMKKKEFDNWLKEYNKNNK